MSAYCYEVWYERPGQRRQLKVAGLLDGVQAMQAAQDLMKSGDFLGCEVWIAVKSLLPLRTTMTAETQEAIQVAMAKSREKAGRVAYKLRVVKDD